jgi:hypothetical protein
VAGEQDLPQGGGLGERAMEPATEGENMNGTGGGAGGGTMAGSGDPTGPGVNAGIKNPLQMPGIAGEDAEVVSKIAALGSADGALADAAGVGGSGGPTMEEAIGASAGSDIGSGTPGDRGETGGGDPNR